jgi:hypothetical protein
MSRTRIVCFNQPSEVSFERKRALKLLLKWREIGRLFCGWSLPHCAITLFKCFPERSIGFINWIWQQHITQANQPECTRFIRLVAIGYCLYDAAKFCFIRRYPEYSGRRITRIRLQILPCLKQNLLPPPTNAPIATSLFRRIRGKKCYILLRYKTATFILSSKPAVYDKGTDRTCNAGGANHATAFGHA